MGTLWVEKQQWTRRGSRSARGRPRRARPGRARQPRRKPRPAARPGHLARLLPHQGRLCSLDAPRPRRRRRALRRSPRLRSGSRHAISAISATAVPAAFEKTPRSRPAPAATSPGSSPTGSMPTRACPTSPSTASFPHAAQAGNWLVAVNICQLRLRRRRSSRHRPLRHPTHSVTQRVRRPRPRQGHPAHPRPGQAHRGPGQRRHRPRNPGQRPHY